MRVGGFVDESDGDGVAGEAGPTGRPGEIGDLAARDQRVRAVEARSRAGQFEGHGVPLGSVVGRGEGQSRDNGRADGGTHPESRGLDCALEVQELGANVVINGKGRHLRGGPIAVVGDAANEVRR